MWSNVCLEFRKKEEDYEGEKKVMHWLHVAVEALLSLLLLSIEEHIWNRFFFSFNEPKTSQYGLKKKKMEAPVSSPSMLCGWMQVRTHPTDLIDLFNVGGCLTDGASIA